MNATKKVIFIIIGLITIFLIVDISWGITNILNMQLCTYGATKNFTCEQIAENNAKNCSYIILRWKRVDYNKELNDCKNWELKQK